MLRWLFLTAGAFLFAQPVTQLVTMVYVLSLFGIGPWSKSFYNMNLDFLAWTSLKLIIGLSLLGLAAALFRRQKRMSALSGTS